MATIAEICHAMRDFQKVRAIKGQAITNVQYLYDTARYAKLAPKARATIVLSMTDDPEGSPKLIAHHIVIEFNDGMIVDPSYDVASLKNKTYFSNVKDLINSFDDKTELDRQCNLKHRLREHIIMTRVAEQINNGQAIVSDKQFYNEQANYIDRLFKAK